MNKKNKVLVTIFGFLLMAALTAAATYVHVTDSGFSWFPGGLNTTTVKADTVNGSRNNLTLDASDEVVSLKNFTAPYIHGDMVSVNVSENITFDSGGKIYHNGSGIIIE